jgi:DNA-binding GntR family transcriptional regulator
VRRRAGPSVRQHPLIGAVAPLAPRMRTHETVEIRPMNAEHQTGTPIYKQVAMHIISEISAHEAKAGARLPSEDALSQLFGVTRTTVRRSLGDLVQKGLLNKVHGGGTFFRGTDVIEQPLATSMVSFSEALDDLGLAFETQVIEARRVSRPPESVTARLEQDGSAYYLRRLRSVNGVPMMLVDCYVGAREFPGLLDRDFSQRRLFSVLSEDYGVEVSHGTRTFAAIAATAELARCLRVSVSDPLLYAEQTARRADERAVEVSNIWFSGRHFKLVANLSRPKNE